MASVPPPSPNAAGATVGNRGCCGSCGAWANQVKLLLRKNYLIRRRALGTTCCELLLPVVIVLLLVAVRSAFHIDDYDDQQYVSPASFAEGDAFDYNAFKYDGDSDSPVPRIVFVPDNAFVRNLTLAANASLSALCPGPLCVPVVVPYPPPFASEDDLLTYIDDADYARPQKPSLALAVVFHQFGRAAGVPDDAVDSSAPNTWDYIVRVNRTAVTYADQNTNPYSVQHNTGYTEFQSSMFSWMQTFLDRHITDAAAAAAGGLGAAATVEYREIATPMPIPAHKQDTFSTVFSSVIPLFFILSYLYPCARIVRNLVEEKELRLKEGLRMMGLTDSAHWTAWYLTYVIQFGITALLIMIVGSGSIFKYSDKGIVWIFFWVFGVAMMSYAAAISTLFDRAKTASTMAYLFIFGAYIPTFVLGSNGGSASTYSEAAMTWAGLLPPTALGLGSTQISFLEGYQLGVTSSTVNLLTFNYRFGDAFGFLFLDVFVYGLLSWYLDKVLPSEFGNPLEPWFCCLRTYWVTIPPNESEGADRAREPAMQQYLQKPTTNENEEPVSADVRKGLAVSIRGLRKEYSAASSGGAVNVAVDNLSLDMYENQIFCLLGHNGAGKSTTISMLTGLTPISAGDAIVDGLSVRHDMQALRQRIGVCPQHDVLFPTLTVREHLELYSAIKGVPAGDIERWVTEAIAHVGLTEKENSFSSSLSGGQKRKLSVAIAFTGRSKVVFLDEPTSGMDPYSRRATWETLQKFKAGRVIVLTTHFMDEADILGDRIGIMTHGHVQCCGSPLFLKALYGVGYTVTFTRDHEKPRANGNGNGHDEKQHRASTAPDPLVALVRSLVPRAEPLTSIGAELSYRMPLDASPAFPGMFREIDAHRSTYCVVNYGISVTTLEEVFLKVGGAQTHTHAGSPKNKPANGAAPAAAGGLDAKANGATVVDDDELATALRVEQEMNRTDAEVCGRHFRALFMKRVNYFKRDKRAVVFQLAIPVLFLILGFGVLSSPSNVDKSEYYFDTESYNSPTYTPISTAAAPDFAAQLQAFAAAAAPSLSTNVQLQPSGDQSVAAFSDMLLATRNEFEQSKYFAYYPMPQAEAVAWVNSTVLDRSTLRTTDPVGFVNGTGAFISGGSGSGLAKQFVFYLTNVTGYQSLPIMANIAHNALFRNRTGDARATIFAGIHTFPLTKQQKVLVTAGTGFGIAIITVIAFLFIPASYAVFVVRERETKIKHIQTISGVSQLAYWTSTYCWDMVNYLVPFVASIIVVAAFDNSSFTGENFGAVVLAFLFYGVAVAPFTYLASFLFQSHSTAQTMLILVYFVTGLLFLIVSFALSLISSTQSAQKSLKFIFRLFPPFCLGDTMVGLATRDLAVQLLGVDTKPGPYDLLVSGYNIIYLVLEAVVYFGLTLLAERYVSSPEPWSSCASSDVSAATVAAVGGHSSVAVAPMGEGDDVDVIAEAARIDAGHCAEAAIRIQHLKKTYPGDPPKHAVRNLSYAVAPGECFGFLGINGAGKTTTLSMLSGEFPSTSGDAHLMNHSIRTEQDKCRRLIGYCPQFDALLDLLTAREHLELFARIKGVKEQQIGGMVDTMLRRLTLTEYADRPAGSYSGGNKRKLCVGIALIGNPPIVFLDEPSTGMDPVSRRFMWDFISQTMKGRSVILTTHSMEECEALCHRLGIMVGGRLRCIGSTQHLKTRFGSGYQLDVNVRDERVGGEATKAFIGRQFPGAQLVEFHGTRLKYVLPRTNALQQPLSLAAVFEAIEQHKEQLTVREYSVGQTSLEQIFIDFAKQQNEEKGAIAGFGAASAPAAAAATAAPASIALAAAPAPMNYGSQSHSPRGTSGTSVRINVADRSA